MAKKTMSIGGATYDLFVRVPHQIIEAHGKHKHFSLPLGEKVPVDNIVETCGGGACNTATGLSRLGCDASFEGVIASDQWGEKLIEKMKKEKVNTDLATIVEGEVSSFSIILSASSGERVILYEGGTNMHLHEMTFDRDALKQMDWIYLNHIQEESCSIQDDIVAMLIDHSEARLTWNPGGCQIDRGITEKQNAMLLKETDLMLLNKEEALRFTKTETIDEAMHILKNAGVTIICITDGSRGTAATDGKILYHCPVLQDVNVLDTTGAGDAFGTGVTWALLEGMNLPDALRAGTINAASVVSALGAQAGLLTDIEMRKQMKTVALDVTEQSFA